MTAESFGVDPLPGTRIARNHGEHMPHDGVTFQDSERPNPPNLDMGKGKMKATAHSHHGPHHHDEPRMPKRAR